MKKIIFTIISLILFIGIANAKSCTVISGTGKNLGDEIACGSENFYVISNDGEQVKMLSKYNLLIGNSYLQINLDGYVGTFAEVYELKEVKEKLDDNYSISGYNGTYNSETGKYTFNSISLTKIHEYGYFSFYIDKVNSKKEIIQHEQIRKMLEKGYYINSYSGSTASGYNSVSFYKDYKNEYKTIYLDGTFISELELYNKEEVKKILSEGYKVHNSFYESSSCDATNTKCLQDYFAVTFKKSYNYDYVNVILDEEIAYNEKDNYANQNEEIKKLLNQGYEISNYLTQLYYTGTNTRTSKVVGYELRKATNSDEPKLDIYQSEKAIGAHGDEAGNPLPEEIGIIEAMEVWGEEYGEIYSSGYSDYEYEKSINNIYSDIGAYTYLSWYKNTLNNMGYNILDINTLSVSEINNIAKEATGEELPLEDWYNTALEEANEEYFSNSDFYILGSLKNLLPEKYDWIYSTTYWTRTSNPSGSYIYFIDTLGDLCATYYCQGAIGAGLRPVITLSASDLIYTITTKTDGNGSITPSAETEHSGNEVTFVVTPNEGFELKEVKVTDSNGNTITFTDYKFTMPDANVVIEAIFVAENPETSDILILSCIVIIFLGTVLTYINIKKMNEAL